MARQGDAAAYLMSNSSQGCPFTNYPYTVSIWHYRPSGIGSGAVFGYADSAVNVYSMIYSNSTNIYTYLNGNNDMGAVAAAAGWNHYAWRCAGTTDRSFIVNGSAINVTASILIPGGVNRYAVMVSPQSGLSYTMGSGERVAELGIWNTAILNTDLISMYQNKLSPLMLSRKSLVTYCPLNDGDSGARDLIGGRNLAESGTAVLTDNPPLLYKRRSFMTFTPGVSLSTYSSIFHGSVF